MRSRPPRGRGRGERRAGPGRTARAAGSPFRGSLRGWSVVVFSVASDVTRGDVVPLSEISGTRPPRHRLAHAFIGRSSAGTRCDEGLAGCGEGVAVVEIRAAHGACGDASIVRHHADHLPLPGHRGLAADHPAHVVRAADRRHRGALSCGVGTPSHRGGGGLARGALRGAREQLRGAVGRRRGAAGGRRHPLRAALAPGAVRGRLPRLRVGAGGPPGGRLRTRRRGSWSWSSGTGCSRCRSRCTTGSARTRT